MNNSKINSYFFAAFVLVMSFGFSGNNQADVAARLDTAPHSKNAEKMRLSFPTFDQQTLSPKFTLKSEQGPASLSAFFKPNIVAKPQQFDEKVYSPHIPPLDVSRSGTAATVTITDRHQSEIDSGWLLFTVAVQPAHARQIVEQQLHDRQIALNTDGGSVVLRVLNEHCLQVVFEQVGDNVVHPSAD